MKKIFSVSRTALSLCLMLGLLCGALTACRTAPSAQGGEAVTLTDALGREVSIARHPTRVAALLGSFADVWVLAGGELCAAAEDAWEDFGLTLDGAVNIGGAHSPSLELLISADPQLVLASASTASHVEMRQTLETMGITVVYFDIDSFEDYLAMLRVCTDITARDDLYEQNGLQLKAQIDQLKAQYAAAPLSAQQRRVLLLRASSTSVKAKGSEGTILGEMLADMGCVNIADGDSGLLENLSVEAVMREEPYHIFVVTMGSNTEKAQASLETMMKENPAWGTLTAVAEGRLHMMDKTLFNLKPNARYAQAYGILYETLIQP